MPKRPPSGQGCSRRRDTQAGQRRGAAGENLAGIRSFKRSPNPHDNAGYSFAARSRSALPMTDTELSDIARAATTGLSRMPNTRIQDARRDRDADRVVGEGEGQVLPDVAHGHPAERAGADDPREVALDQGDPGALDRDLGARCPWRSRRRPRPARARRSRRHPPWRRSSRPPAASSTMRSLSSGSTSASTSSIPSWRPTACAVVLLSPGQHDDVDAVRLQALMAARVVGLIGSAIAMIPPGLPSMATNNDAVAPTRERVSALPAKSPSSTTVVRHQCALPRPRAAADRARDPLRRSPRRTRPPHGTAAFRSVAAAHDRGRQRVLARRVRGWLPYPAGRPR